MEVLLKELGSLAEKIRENENDQAALPLATMLIFTVLFGRWANMPSDGMPYPLFAFCGLLTWNFFA